MNSGLYCWLPGFTRFPWPAHCEKHPDDNRLTRVKPTPEGKNFVEKVYGTRVEFMARMLQGIPAKNIPVIISGLRRMSENLGDMHPLP